MVPPQYNGVERSDEEYFCQRERWMPESTSRNAYIWGEAGGRTKRSKQAGGTGEEWPGKGKERRSLIT